MKLRTGVAAITLAGVAAVGVTTYGVHRLLDHVTPLFEKDECTATVDGRTVTLTPEQAENAALIAAISVDRGMPARAATIALATAYQESKLYNIDYGDRDSSGSSSSGRPRGGAPRRRCATPSTPPTPSTTR